MTAKDLGASWRSRTSKRPVCISIPTNPPPIAYYRLKMIDLDGTFSHSEVVYLENNSGGAAGVMKVYPSPSNGRFTVDLTEVSHSAEQTGELRLVDLHGRTVWSGLTSETGQRIAVELPVLPPGFTC